MASLTLIKLCVYSLLIKELRRVYVTFTGYREQEYSSHTRRTEGLTALINQVNF